MSLAMTQAGMILGTAAYMAPEQARGKSVDKRADIWAFGVVLYEMLTGRQLFGGGETIADTLASVVKDAPDLTALPADTPLHIRRLVERCLQKDPLKRLRDIGEARITIDAPAEPPAVAPFPQRRSWVPWAVAAIVAIAGSLGWWRANRPTPLRPLERLEVALSDMPITSNGAGATIALSRDGQRIVVTARKDGKVQLYTRLLNQAQLTALSGTEEAYTPFFSPDGRWIGFAANGKLKKVSVDGGTPVTLADTPNLRGASWGDDGYIVFTPTVTGPLWRVSAEGGAATELTKLANGERTHRFPEVLPGSRAILFTSHTAANLYDDAAIDVFIPATGQRKRLRTGGFSPHYVALPDGSGRLLYQRQSTVYVGPFDVSALEAGADFAPVLEDVYSYAPGGGSFAVSATGALIYSPGMALGATVKVFSVEPTGRKEALHKIMGAYMTPRFSPDGKRIAFSAAAENRFDLLIKDIGRDTVRRASFVGGVASLPVWTPDGKHIVFLATANERPGVYWMRSDGGGQAHKFLEQDALPSSFSPDGKRLAFSKAEHLFTVQLTDDPEQPKAGDPEPLAVANGAQLSPAFSPDGRWIAYSSNEGGRFDIYVRPYPVTGGGWQVSMAGGSFPVWSRAGHELLYRAPDGHIMSVDYAVKGDTFSPGKPRLWADVFIPVLTNLPAFDLAPDGKRLAAVMPDGEESPHSTNLIFLMNFADELQRMRAR
jgi:serine/threonine-protein kinase